MAGSRRVQSPRSTTTPAFSKAFCVLYPLDRDLFVDFARQAPVGRQPHEHRFVRSARFGKGCLAERRGCDQRIVGTGGRRRRASEQQPRRRRAQPPLQSARGPTGLCAAPSGQCQCGNNDHRKSHDQAKKIPCRPVWSRATPAPARSAPSVRPSPGGMSPSNAPGRGRRLRKAGMKARARNGRAMPRPSAANSAIAGISGSSSAAPMALAMNGPVHGRCDERGQQAGGKSALRRSGAGKAGHRKFKYAQKIGGDRAGQQEQRRHHPRFLQLERPAHLLPSGAQAQQHRAQDQAGQDNACRIGQPFGARMRLALASAGKA